ncbi:MAG: choice-of-anchor E domain-containing protein [Verrucomicrobia bacterium]|nr:choice-of-anchor E domain-containing protein [Verrucomicrobiota bacterium]
MVRLRWVLAGVICLACVLALAPRASATTSSETLPFDFPLSPGSQTLSFQQFDDNGGLCTLEKVTIYLCAEEHADVTGENDSEIGGSMTLNLTGWVQASGGGLSVVAIMSALEGPVSVTATDGVPDSGLDFYDFGTVSDIDTATSTLTSGLAPFIGLGTIDIGILGQGGFSISGVTDSTLKVSNFGSCGYATITYEYTCVPEPATMLLAVSGLGALLLRLRKRG